MSDTHGSQQPASGDQAPPTHASPSVPPQPPYGQPGYGPPAPYQQPYGQSPYGVPPAGATPPGHYPYGQQPYGGYAPHLYGQPGYGPPGFGLRDPNARPGTVVAAGIVTMILSGLVLIVAGLMLIVLLAARSEFMTGFTDETGWGRNSSGLYNAILVALLLMIAWCTAAVVLAILTLRRSQSARITLVVSSSLTILVSLFLITSLVSALTLLGAIAVIILLFTGGAGEWYSGRHDLDDGAERSDVGYRGY